MGEVSSGWLVCDDGVQLIKLCPSSEHLAQVAA